MVAPPPLNRRRRQPASMKMTTYLALVWLFFPFGSENEWCARAGRWESKRERERRSQSKRALKPRWTERATVAPLQSAEVGASLLGPGFHGFLAIFVQFFSGARLLEMLSKAFFFLNFICSGLGLDRFKGLVFIFPSYLSIPSWVGQGFPVLRIRI